MRSGRRAFFAVVASSVALAVGGGALAQRRPAPKPKPTAGADASAPDNPYADDRGDPGGGAGAGKRSDAGALGAAPTASVAPSEGPVARPDLYDGGARPSPLTPAANEFADSGPPPQSLDYDRLLADIAALRARVAAVSDTMFRSRVAVTIETSGDHGRIAKLTVSLDDGVVYAAPQNFRADDATVIYDHAVAPGRHAVTVDVERKDDRDETFRTAQRSRFAIDVPRDHRLQLDVRVWDDSNMGADFPGDKSGRYELKVRAKASAKPVGK